MDQDRFASMGSKRMSARAHVYFLLRRVFSQSQRDTLKRRLVTFRRRLNKAYIVIYGQYTAKELVGELKNRVRDDWEILMVHSSYDHLLPMFLGRPQDLVNELIAFCGKDRTLVMPTFVLGGRLYDKEQYFSTHAFDLRRTPSEMGLLTEVFRRTPGAKRSLHPTHSICAFGPLAEELTVTHHLAATRTGLGTPFNFMAERKTAIVGLGVEYYRCLTQTHTAEDILGDAFPVQFEKAPFPVTLIDSKGNKLQYSLTIPKTSLVLDNTFLRFLLPENDLIEWNFRGTAMFVTWAGAITECLIGAAKKGVTVYRAPNSSVREAAPQV